MKGKLRMKKKVRLCAVLLLFCLLLNSVQAAAYSDERTFGMVTGEDVRLRSGAGTDSDVLAELKLNAEVEILSEAGGWYRVIYEGTVGYVHQDLIFVNDTGSRAAYVLEDGVKLRGGPGQLAYVVAELAASQGVKVKQMIGDWYFVFAGDQTGYVHRSYLLMTRATNTASRLLKVGMEGQEVLRMQTELYDRGFMSKSDVTGTFGAKTRAAVSDFQKACAFSEDGVAGAQTLEALYDPSNTVNKENALAVKVQGSVELLDWFKGGAEWLNKGAKFQVVDARTKLSFNVRRFGGWYHADSEPITAADTAIFKKIVNGKWTWDRRAIWVIYKGRAVAASMNCMPHLSSPTKGNNFPGHFCIHLYNSKVHENSKECPRHQSMVQSAYRSGR